MFLNRGRAVRCICHYEASSNFLNANNIYLRASPCQDAASITFADLFLENKVCFIKKIFTFAINFFACIIQLIPTMKKNILLLVPSVGILFFNYKLSIIYVMVVCTYFALKSTNIFLRKINNL